MHDRGRRRGGAQGMRPRTRSKYLVDVSPEGKEERTYNGTLYRSKLEARHAWELDLMVRAGEVSDWDYERRLPIVVNGMAICLYLADFTVRYADGTVQIHETKGFATSLYLLKRRLLAATYLRDHPEIVFREIR
jgi:hypothetical protein